MNGLDDLLYISSTSDSSTARRTITLTFETGTDPDIAQVQVQNKLQLAMPLLPQEVQQQGVSVTKAQQQLPDGRWASSPSDGSMDRERHRRLRRVATCSDPISRVPGVGNVTGVRRAVRDAHLARPGQAEQLRPDARPTWSTPIQRAERAGRRPARSAALPAVPGQQLNATIIAQDRLQTPEQFRDIVRAQ